MDFQIMLLPRRDYWEWVRACRDYVMRYGINLTSDPETAARYMAPLQVVSFPEMGEPFAEVGDLRSWFSEKHEGIWLDPIPAGNPSELQETLQARLDKEDRFGQKQKPFYLLWPTDYPVVTQGFGANAHIYTRFGMPGHEGLDIRALPGSEVFACADGWVYRVHRGRKDHAYGIHIRIQHELGYKTVYGHLMEPLVEVGQQVKAGEVIAKADSTGASTAAHLHLTLKKDGSTARKETRFPKDVVDPTPFMVLPDRSQRWRSKALRSWPVDVCLFGAHLRVGGDPLSDDLELARQANLQAVRLEVQISTASLRAVRAALPECLPLMRVGLPEDRSGLTADRFVRAVQQDIARHYQEGVRLYELVGTANLQSEGWNRLWRSGAEFSGFLLEVMRALRERWPDISLGFPGLSPGGYLSGWREDAPRFLDGAGEAVIAADWLGVNCHWRSRDELRSPQGGRWFAIVRDLYPGQTLVVTEFNNPGPGVPAAERARQYLEFYRMASADGGVRAVFAYAVSAAEGHESVSWRTGERSGLALAAALGERARAHQKR